MNSRDGQYQKLRDGCQPGGRSLVDRLIGLVVPCECALCGAAACGMDLCLPCCDDLPWRPFVAGTELRHVDRVITALDYAYPVRQVVAELKFRRQAQHARFLGDLLALVLAEHRDAGTFVRPDLLVPVPLHWTREVARSYNQAALIAAVVARSIGLRVAADTVRRVRRTEPQTGLSRSRRQRNLRGSFAVVRHVDVAGARIAVVDDVVTTGSTVEELARTLKRAGAGTVEVWAVARA